MKNDAFTKYISEKIMKDREILYLVYTVFILTVVLIATFVLWRLDVKDLTAKIEKKSYILVEGNSHFQEVRPNSVSDQYIKDAITDYVDTVSSVNYKNVDLRHSYIQRYMNPKYQIQYDLQNRDRINKIKERKITELHTVKSHTLKTDDEITYKYVARIMVDIWVDSIKTGTREEVVEMELVLTRPVQYKRWFLEIQEFIKISPKGYQKYIKNQPGEKI